MWIAYLWNNSALGCLRRNEQAKSSKRENRIRCKDLKLKKTSRHTYLSLVTRYFFLVNQTLISCWPNCCLLMNFSLEQVCWTKEISNFKVHSIGLTEFVEPWICPIGRSLLFPVFSATFRFRRGFMCCCSVMILLLFRDKKPKHLQTSDPTASYIFPASCY